jgi:hypothetical protein
VASLLLLASAIFWSELPLLPRAPRAAAAEDAAAANTAHADAPTTVAEARGRARVLHETLHGALQVMHRDFFEEDDATTIPSRSLEDVFKELAREYQIELRWIAVNTDAMSVDHKPRTDFEKDAAQALASGKAEYEATENNVYRHAGPIRLASQCLKCHVPNRKSTADRTAGLVISIPLKSP